MKHEHMLASQLRVPGSAISLHRNWNFPCVKNNFWRISWTRRKLKAWYSESINKDNVSNIWCIGKQLCWRTIRTTKKFLTRTRTVKLLTMSCHIKVRQSFLVNIRRIWFSVKDVDGRLTVVFLQYFLPFCLLWWSFFQTGRHGSQN